MIEKEMEENQSDSLMELDELMDQNVFEVLMEVDQEILNSEMLNV